MYDLHGISATARAAACANWFEEPTTKLSKVYFGFKDIPAPWSRSAAAAAVSSAGGASDSASKRTWTSARPSSRSASSMTDW